MLEWETTEVLIPTGMVAADLDADGDLEFVHATGFSGIRVLEANVAGDYSHVTTHPGPAYGRLAATDIDGTSSRRPRARRARS